MSSNLKVNTVLPSVGTAIGIGTAGGSVSITSDTITALTGGSERLRINSDGKVGLGTTGSDYALSIREADNNNKWLMLQKNSGQEILQIREDGDNHAIIDGSHASGELHFYTAGVERLRINTQGRLGLNTNNPDTTLTVQSGGDAQMSLKNSSGTTKAYVGTAGAFGSAGTDDLRIRSDSSNIVFGFSGAEKFRMTSDSNLGIGVTNPLDSFHISNASPGILITDTDQAANTKNWSITASVSQLLRIQAQDDSNAGGGNIFDFYRVTNQINEFRGLNSGNTWFVIDNLNKKVAIGHTSANAKLHLASGTSSAVGDATNPAFQIGNTTNYRFAIHTTNEQAIIANKNGDDGIAFHTKTGTTAGGFGEAVRIARDGTVTKPKQPYVRIMGITNTGGSGNANNGTATTYGAITYSAGRVTAQVEGNYFISFNTISDNGTGRVDAFIKVNGTSIVNLLTSSNGSGYRQKNGAIVYHLNVNDYVDFENQDWYNAGAVNTAWKTASVYLLG